MEDSIDSYNPTPASKQPTPLIWLGVMALLTFVLLAGGWYLYTSESQKAEREASETRLFEDGIVSLNENARDTVAAQSGLSSAEITQLNFITDLLTYSTVVESSDGSYTFLVVPSAPYLLALDEGKAQQDHQSLQALIDAQDPVELEADIVSWIQADIAGDLMTKEVIDDIYSSFADPAWLDMYLQTANDEIRILLREFAYQESNGRFIVSPELFEDFSIHRTSPAFTKEGARYYVSSWIADLYFLARIAQLHDSQLSDEDLSEIKTRIMAIDQVLFQADPLSAPLIFQLVDRYVSMLALDYPMQVAHLMETVNPEYWDVQSSPTLATFGVAHSIPISR